MTYVKLWIHCISIDGEVIFPWYVLFNPYYSGADSSPTSDALPHVILACPLWV